MPVRTYGALPRTTVLPEQNFQYTRLRPEHVYTIVRTCYLLRLSVHILLGRMAFPLPPNNNIDITTNQNKNNTSNTDGVDERYIYQLMSTVQHPGSNRFDSQMQIRTGDQKYDVSLSK